MIQKKLGKSEKTEGSFLVPSLILLVFAIGSSGAAAQELIPVSVSSVGENTVLGTPVDEIISAAREGGLSTTQNLSSLLPATASSEQTSESPISSERQMPASESSGFNSDSLKNMEIEGGLSSSPQISLENPNVFRTAVKFFERVIFKKDVEFENRVVFDDGMSISGNPTFNQDTAGYAIIREGNQSVAVDFDQKYIDPPVVTAALSLQQYKDPEVRAVAEDLLFVSNVKYIITNVSKKGFEIMMDHKADSDIPFSWHALSVNNPKTSKKKGESLKSVISPDLDPANSREDLSAGGVAHPAAAGQPGASQVPASSAAIVNSNSN